MDVLVFIPVFALVLLNFIKLGNQPPSLPRTLLLWLMLLGVFLGIRPFLTDQFLFPNAEVVKRVEGQLKILRSQKDWASRPVLLIEGSSVTLFGVNDTQLQTLLKTNGIPATVLQFSMAGANHFERLHFLELFWKSLTAKERAAFRETDVILLSEVFDAYDEDPLYLFAREAYSERVILYANAPNSWAAWQAYQIYRREKEITNDSQTVLWPLVENTLLNTFAVGTFSDMKRPKRIKRTGGFFPLTDPKAAFDFNSTWTHFQTAQKSPEPFSSTVPYPQWMQYSQTLHSKLGDWVDHVGFYALPLLEPQRYDYQKAFSQQLPANTIMIGPPDAKVYDSLQTAEFWFDGTHPREPGARVFTEWLGRELIQNWPRLSGQAKPPTPVP